MNRISFGRYTIIFEDFENWSDSRDPMKRKSMVSAQITISKASSILSRNRVQFLVNSEEHSKKLDKPISQDVVVASIPQFERFAIHYFN